MSAYYEEYLDSCPFCDGVIRDKSYDRGIVFVCEDCGHRKDYPGLLQMVKNQYPIPYSDGKGGTKDPSEVKNQEYYHKDASLNAVKEFNDWVKAKRLERSREKKLKSLTDPYTYYNYQKYMKVLNSAIEETERRMMDLEKQKMISQLTHEEWIQWEKGELKLEQIIRDKQINQII
jgi:hypothetical protein